MLIKGYNTEGKGFAMSTSSVSAYQTEQYDAAIYGEIFSNNKKNDFEHIIKLYEEYQDEIVNHLEGLYHLFILDKKKGALNVYQDFLTSSEFLYYCKNDDIWYISTNLQTLLRESGIKRRSNKEAYCDFVKYGYVPKEQTLLKNVYKLSPFNKLKFTMSGAEQREISYVMPECSEEYAKEHWISDLNRAIQINTPQASSISLPISGGYDSNYILGYYAEHTNLPIRLFSIGGNADIDETGSVRKIAKCYNKKYPTLIMGYTSDDMLNHYPELIWRLGGSVFEKGIFLQYRLATELKKAKVTDLVCGECADQVMHEKFQTSNKDSEFYAVQGKKNPYYFASEIIIKKSGILLNSFGIKGHYPFTNQRFAATASGVKAINGTTKVFHQQMCHITLSKEVRKNIHKNGGATSLHALFSSKESMNNFLNKIEKCSLYKKIKKELDSSHKSNKNQTIKTSSMTLSVMFSKGMAKIKDGCLHTVFPSYKKEERRLEYSLSVLYLLIFEELFCKENSQHYLNSNTCDLEIVDFLKKLK